jgi:MOSC domain-containing protein YiiM
MKVISTNISRPTTIQWNGTDRITGIYKKPQAGGIYLSADGVRDDTIGNPKVHGGTQKAAYLYPKDQYPFWKAQYPHLKWEYGMFGENLTVEGMDEGFLRMGDLFQIGEARVRITTPREPCFKLGIRFSDQGIIQKFVDHGYPGSYVAVLEPGWVRPGDNMVLIEAASDQISIAEFFKLWYAAQKDPKLIAMAVQNPWLAENKRRRLKQWLE